MRNLMNANNLTVVISYILFLALLSQLIFFHILDKKKTHISIQSCKMKKKIEYIKNENINKIEKIKHILDKHKHKIPNCTLQCTK